MSKYNPIRPRKIYVASSWRNNFQSDVVEALKHGHEVYDFKNPHPGNTGFNWSQIDHNWREWSPLEYRTNLDHPIAKAGFSSDMNAMKWADTFVLVQPCGRSAHLELGWAVGAGKLTLVILEDGEPELMTKMVDHICVSLNECLEILSK